MISRFEHSEKANYLVLCTEQKEERMADRMLLQNEIKGLLPVRIEWINGCKEYYYDISSRHSLSSIVKKGSLDVPKIQLLIRTIGTILKQFHEFMLEPDGICLSEELIYMALPEWNLMFCYFEEDGRKFSEKLRKLLQFVIEYVDYQDKEAVSLAYACYQVAMQENFTFAKIEECLLKVGKSKEDRLADGIEQEVDVIGGEYKKERIAKGANRQRNSGVQLVAEPRIQSEVMEEEVEENSFNKEKAKRISCYIAGAGSLLTGALWLAASEGIFDSFGVLGETSPIYIAAIGVILTLIAFIVWSMIKRRWKEKTRLVTKEVIYPFEQKEEQKNFKDSNVPFGRQEVNLENKSFKKEEVLQREREQKSERYVANNGLREGAGLEEGRWEEVSQKRTDGVEYGKTVLLSYRVEEEHRILFSCQEEYPSIKIVEFPCSIGKIPSLNQVVITHEGISRIHCSIQKETSGYTITDRNSTNGVIVNGKRLIPNETVTLPIESEIVLGILRYIFR